MCGLNIEYMLEQGLDSLQKRAEERSGMLYNYIDNSDGYYKNMVDKRYRSRMNIPFLVKDDEQLAKQFVKDAAEEGLIDLSGHRSVGGCRASLYNAMPIEGV